MPVDGVIPALLRKQRQKKEEEKLKTEAFKGRNRLDPNDLHVGETHLPRTRDDINTQHTQYPIRGASHRPSLLSENNSHMQDRQQSVPMGVNIGADLSEVDKECLLERLVLEQVIATIFNRCFSFFVLFLCLLTVMWLSFPATLFRPVHQSIERGYDLAGSFVDVGTVEDIQEYLTSAAAMSHAFSPGSSDYLDDVQSKSFIHSPQTFPPVTQLGHNQFPSLTTSFTITVWVMTKVRLDAIIRKTANGLTCWSVGPEAVIFGEHDSHRSEVVVHPWATNIYRPGVSQADAWKVSEIRKKVSDHAWHNLGFRVTASNIDFVYDGTVVSGQSRLRRPVTDCPGGIVTIGSKRFVAEMSDLVFFNRYLQDEELDETFLAGRPIDVMLSGSGPRASKNELTVQQQLVEMDADLKDRFRDMKDNAQIGQRNTVQEILKQNGGKVSVDTANTINSTSTDTRSTTTTTTTITGTTTGTQTVDKGNPPIMYEKARNLCVAGNSNKEKLCATATVKGAARILDLLIRDFRENAPVAEDFVHNISTELMFFSFSADLLAQCMQDETIGLTQNMTPESLMSMDATSLRDLARRCPNLIAQMDQKNISMEAFMGLSTLFIRMFRTAVLLAEQQNCHIHEKYRDDCAFTCGLSCSTSQGEPSHKSVDHCADTDAPDPWGENCAWYQVNDADCERYSSDATKRNCPKTCNLCAIGPKELQKRVEEVTLNDNILNVEDFNLLLLRANRDDMLIPRNTAYVYVAYFCCLEMELHKKPSGNNWKTVLNQNSNTTCDYINPNDVGFGSEKLYLGLRQDIRSAFREDYPHCFPDSSGTDSASQPLDLTKIGFPRKWFDQSETQGIIADIFMKGAVFGAPREKTRAVFLRGSDRQTRTIRGNVQRFTHDSQMGDQFSLVVEEPEWEWKACTQDSDCSAMAFACRPDHYDEEGYCKTMYNVGLFPQRQFCASTCWTGLCPRKFLERGGKVCQPCDASDEDGGQCGEFPTNGEVRKNTVKYTTKLDRISSDSQWNPFRDVRESTFSISVWVKDFRFQRLFEKRVNVILPPAYADFEGYNATTGTLSCYWLSYSEFCFRTHWYDRKLTCHANPLSSMLRDDKWHHIAVVKRAKEKTSIQRKDGSEVQLKVRVDTLVFFVDGKEGASISLKPYDMSDCGGPMVSTVEIKHAQDDVTVGADITATKKRMRKVAGTEFSHLLPFGGKHAMVLRFAGLGVPKGAVVKRAYLELSAVQNPVQPIIEKLKCGSKIQEGTKKQEHQTEEQVLQQVIFSLLDELQPECILNATSNDCTMVNLELPLCMADVKEQINRTNPVRVTWNMAINEWRKTKLMISTTREHNGKLVPGAYESAAYDAATESESVRISPDVSDLVKTILDRETYDREKTEATFAIVNDELFRPQDCRSPALSLNAFLKDFVDRGVENTCGSLHKFSDLTDEEFLLFALSKEGARHTESGSAPRLHIHWCHTEDCISPTFAGAGDDVKWGAKGFSPSQDSDLSVNDRLRYSTNQIAAPVFNDEPYMVFGASTTDDQDPVLEGQMFDLRTMPKAMTLGDVQQMYYANIRGVPGLPGPERAIGAQSDESQLDVSEYTKDVVSIAPPVMLQTRNLRSPCSDLVPALGDDMTTYFNLQVSKKCGINGPYSCNFSGDADAENGFFCVDRSQYLTSGCFFGRDPVTFAHDASFFPEFLEVMNLETVYREKQMLATKNWVDLQSSTIMLISVFLAPSQRIGTVMQLKFENLGAGKVEPSYSLSSFKQMSNNEQKIWITLCTIIWIICILEICFIFATWLFRVQDRKKWRYLALAYRKKRTENIRGNQANMTAEEQEYAERAESHRLKRRMTLITKNSPIFNFWDIFDLGLRVCIFVFVSVYVFTYFSPGLSSTDPSAQIGKMEAFMKQILRINWHSKDLEYKEKVQQFNDQIRDIVAKVEFLLQMRIFGAILILVCLFRIIVYLRVHPRVAILYKTVASSLDDLFHFSITFSFLYAVLAFTATWTFGAMDERFVTFSASCYAQFNMIIGEFPMDQVAELQSFYVAYLFVFCVMMFLTVMNFFLAIIIDSYGAIKEQVDECAVAHNFFVDLYHSYVFHWYRWKRNWPGRWQLIDSLLRADLDGNNVNDEEQSFAVPVRPHDLVAQDIFPDLDSATDFVAHYLRISPHIAGAKRAGGSAKNASVLEHRAALKRLLQLDLVSHDLRGLHREVHPLGRRSEETKELVKQLVRTGQKLLNALRIDKTLFAPEQLLQDGDEVVNGTLMPSANVKVFGDSIHLGSALSVNTSYGNRSIPDSRPTIEPQQYV